jgi:hypothetical protein
MVGLIQRVVLSSTRTNKDIAITRVRTTQEPQCQHATKGLHVLGATVAPTPSFVKRSNQFKSQPSTHHLISQPYIIYPINSKPYTKSIHKHVDTQLIRIHTTNQFTSIQLYNKSIHNHTTNQFTSKHIPH